MRDAAEYGGESGGDEFAAAWPDDAPAVGAVGDGGAALLTEMGGAALAAAAAARPWRQLSRGERTLLALARLCCEPPTAAAPPSALLIADEFTSFVDRSLAKRAAEALGRAWRRRGDGRRLVLAGVHADFLRELRPEWVFETAAGELTSWEREQVELSAGALAPPAVRAIAPPGGTAWLGRWMEPPPPTAFAGGLGASIVGAPVSALQAFGIALSAFAFKI